MFAKGASGSHVSTEMYDAHLEDFAAEDNSLLDKWVFEKVKKFLENADDSMKKKLRRDQNVFFLHLLGKDHIGGVKQVLSMAVEWLRNGIELIKDYSIVH